MTHRPARVASFVVACAALAMPVSAQRLPDTITPSHYTLRFTPDLAAARSQRAEDIAVRVARPAAAIVLNAIDLVITDATVMQGATTTRATVTYDAEKQQATLSFERPLSPGGARIRTHFTGSLNEQLGGFYLRFTTLRRGTTCADRTGGNDPTHA